MYPTYATISFTDIKGFTTMCTRVTADVLAAFMTAYFEVQTCILQAYRGVVDKYIGDCLMFFYFLPSSAYIMSFFMTTPSSSLNSAHGNTAYPERLGGLKDNEERGLEALLASLVPASHKASEMNADRIRNMYVHFSFSIQKYPPLSGSSS